MDPSRFGSQFNQARLNNLDAKECSISSDRSRELLSVCVGPVVSCRGYLLFGAREGRSSSFSSLLPPLDWLMRSAVLLRAQEVIGYTPTLPSRLGGGLVVGVCPPAVVTLTDTQAFMKPPTGPSEEPRHPTPCGVIERMMKSSSRSMASASGGRVKEAVFQWIPGLGSTQRRRRYHKIFISLLLFLIVCFKRRRSRGVFTLMLVVWGQSKTSS